MRYDELIKKLEDMGDRYKRHDYAIGNYWNAVDEAAEALKDLQEHLTKAHDRINEYTRMIDGILDATKKDH